MATPLAHALPPSTSGSRPPQPPKKRRRGVLAAIIAVAALTALVGSGFAASVTINSGNAIEFGQGKNAVSACDSSATAGISSSYDSSDARVEVSSLTIEGLGATCDSKYLRVSMLDTTGTVVDSVVWYLDNGTLTCATGFRAVANGSTTASSNAASSGVCTAYPNETGSSITVTGASIPSVADSDLNLALTGGSSNGESAASVDNLLVETSDTVFTSTD